MLRLIEWKTSFNHFFVVQGKLRYESTCCNLITSQYMISGTHICAMSDMAACLQPTIVLHSSSFFFDRFIGNIQSKIHMSLAVKWNENKIRILLSLSRNVLSISCKREGKILVQFLSAWRASHCHTISKKRQAK